MCCVKLKIIETPLASSIRAKCRL